MQSDINAPWTVAAERLSALNTTDLYKRSRLCAAQANSGNPEEVVASGRHWDIIGSYETHQRISDGFLTRCHFLGKAHTALNPSFVWRINICVCYYPIYKILHSDVASQMLPAFAGI